MWSYRGKAWKKQWLILLICPLTVCSAGFQAVEELLESLELEKSSYHMGLSRVSIVTDMHTFHLIMHKGTVTVRL